MISNQSLLHYTYLVYLPPNFYSPVTFKLLQVVLKLSKTFLLGMHGATVTNTQRIRQTKVVQKQLVTYRITVDSVGDVGTCLVAGSCSRSSEGSSGAAVAEPAARRSKVTFKHSLWKPRRRACPNTTRSSRRNAP